ncbi:carboxypeptidase-like regulatory domain-containing protein [Mucilaginibacter psychrotolerans]|uniref:Carboxypeptidase-like regulatory domain-containing protein n=1 Tax=Mucilaginibacter psychrotolerans TaxID=1524096 RepID=A0A4Y8S9Q1_9SPHI|nr:carboxypeptidase-like regulatory domain-containing protein [Mucilaginibacter psychrotolerans]TFF35365.1 carboxypeptidase-like regulatory domain-containing protein [Mucilaginibacter psychrotolerans]
MSKIAPSASSLKAILLLILLVFSCTLANAQHIYSITGNVKDDGGNLPGATVYITGTKLITACNATGDFLFANLVPGTYGVVVQMVGYKPLAKSVTVNGQSVKVDFKLETVTNSLQQVVIHAETNWEEHYRIFQKRFLGTTSNASDCKIINPKILHFHFDKETSVLSGSAEEFLIIENQALGYRIKYLLTNFEYNEQTSILKYQGYPSFEEMQPKTDRVAQAWQRNRDKAYKGSVIHFLRAIYNGNVYTSGYEIFKVLNKPLPGEEPDPKKPIFFDRRPVLCDSLVKVVDADFKELSFKDCLFVLNYREQDASELAASGYKIDKPVGGRLPNGQISVVRLLDPSVTIDANGNYSDPGGLLFEGYMAWEQVADMLPLEYGKAE